MSKYILAIDQSTSGTKAMIFDDSAKIIGRSDLPHEQKISSEGWVSHDPIEIYNNTISCVKNVVFNTGINKEDILAVGISNQRETAMVWNGDSGEPVCDAVVWQCGRGEDICKRLEDRADIIHGKTGLMLSPYFSGAKISWVLENVPGINEKKLCAGTIDSWLVYKLTGGKEFKTDYSNASRTQLFNINTLSWDEEICSWFGIPTSILPKVCNSNSVFGWTDFEGFLDKPIPINSDLGDSHGALFGQGCLKKGMIKATYGTGSSVMMNIGDKPIFNDKGLVTSIGWGMDGEISYVLEGNINYTGSVIKWLVDDMRLINSSKEAGQIAMTANKDDTTYLVPAFTGLGAPHFKSEAKAIICGMTRKTGRSEIVKAGEESIAYQIADIINVMRGLGLEISELRADGGPTKDKYLMQFQSDILNTEVAVPQDEELSAMGVAYAAGIAIGLYTLDVVNATKRTAYNPEMNEDIRNIKYNGWQEAVNKLI